VNFRVQRWIANRRVFSAQSSASATLGLRLLDYPGWQVQVDGTSGRAMAAPDTAQMFITVPAGVHDVNVEFRSTWDRTVGALISLIFAIAILVFLLANRISLRKL